MTLDRLKTIRFVAPAIISLAFVKLLGLLTGLWTTTLPNFEKAIFLPIVVVPALLYYITPFRRWANDPFHRRITERLRAGLVDLSGYPDQKDKFTWRNLRSLFFSLVDGDKSLEQKAKLAYWNGAIWTTFADSAVLSILFFLASMLLYYLGFQDAFPAGMIFLLLFSLSIAGSEIATRRHIAIGEEQLEVIELKYKSEVQDRLNKL